MGIGIEQSILLWGDRVAMYDREAAVAYAQKWALGRNSKFSDFEKYGGDCTNFVSQCLLAGGCEMNFKPEHGWFYINADRRTPAWSGVKFLNRFLMLNEPVGPRGRLVERSELLPGDVILLGRADGVFYHTLLVIVADEQDVFVAAHSMDVWMRRLSDYSYAQARFLHIATGT